MRQNTRAAVLSFGAAARTGRAASAVTVHSSNRRGPRGIILALFETRFGACTAP
jgi:hypothetical protein